MTNFDDTKTLDLFIDDLDDNVDVEDMFSDDDAAEAWQWATDDVAEIKLS